MEKKLENFFKTNRAVQCVIELLLKYIIIEATT